jgi:hypothetical protein
VENPLAQAILSGEFVTGDIINVDIRDDNLVFKKSDKKASAA